MLICNLQLKINKNTECPFLTYRLFVKVKHLSHLSGVNLPLGKFVHTLTAFYHLPKILALLTHLLIDASKHAPVGLNYTLN